MPTPQRELCYHTNVEYWALRMYDQLDAGILYDYQVSELEALIDDYYRRHDPETDNESEV